MEPKLDILPSSQRNLWPQLGIIPGKFVLYGGTVIALRFGHRESIDFDFFSSEPFHGDEILLASPYDLFATKLKVIQDRGEKKDYLDIIEFLNQGYDFGHGLTAAAAVYRNKFNPQISLRAAVSFIDGDLPSLTREHRQTMEKAVANFWSSKPDQPETTAESSNLSVKD